VPQGNLPGILARRAGGAPLPATATDQAGQTTLAQGRFLTFDNQVDAATGTVRAKARFPNRDGRLFPNQFVNIRLLVEMLKGAPTVPVTAVRNGTQGDFVFVLQPDHSVKMQTVKQGPASGSRVAILSGLRIGETVITEGADNLEDGSKVVLPGERPQFPRRKKSGFFASLFGGGEEAQQGHAGGNAQGQGAHRRQRHQGGGAAQ